MVVMLVSSVALVSLLSREVGLWELANLKGCLRTGLNHNNHERA